VSEYILIRHGQASFGKENYDQLSEIGKVHTYQLGQYLANNYIKIDKVYLGALYRHLQTANQIKLAYQEASIRLPAFIVNPNLNEHHGPQVVRKYFDALKLKEGDEGEFARNFNPKDKQHMSKYFKIFNDITLRWAEGEIEDPAIQSWSDFRTQTKEALKTIMQDDKGGERILIISSGGPVASLTGEALSISEKKIMGLAQEIFNASFTKILRSSDELSLKIFNKHVYTDKKLITLV